MIRFRVGGAFTTRGTLWQVSVNGTDPHPLLPAWHTTSQRMLRPMDPRRKIFRFPVRSQYLGLARKREICSGKADTQPVQLTSGPMSFFSPLLSKDGKKLFVVGALSRGELARYDTKSAAFVPFLSGISADSVSFSRGWQVGGLCQLPGGHTLEKQIGWQPANSTHLPAAQPPDCLAGHPMASRSFSMHFCPAREAEVVHGFSRWRNSARNDT